MYVRARNVVRVTGYPYYPRVRTPGITVTKNDTRPQVQVHTAVLVVPPECKKTGTLLPRVPGRVELCCGVKCSSTAAAAAVVQHSSTAAVLNIAAPVYEYIRIGSSMC